MTDDLKFYTEKTFLPAPDDKIFYGFFTRLGGVSSAPYEGLNCGIGSGDKAGNIQTNRAKVAAAAGVKPENLLPVYQVHQATTLYADKPWEERPKADSVVTDKPGIGLSILTAECAPVLFIGEKENNAPVIGAAHAAWKGSLTGVLDNTVKEMEKRGALKSQIRACIGPSISRRSYEVDKAFMKNFTDQDEDNERFFHSTKREGHAMFDLPGYCAHRLSGLGLKNIALLDLDTYGNETEFFSYRRATHRAESDYGRQISVICIK